MMIWNRNRGASDPSSSSKSSHNEDGKSGSGTRVLIIDADPLVRNVLEVAIGTLGNYEIATASDGDAVLAMIDSYHPNVVLLDLLVPGVDGFTILARLSDRSRRHVRVIVTSGVMDAGMAPHLARLGADAVLPRPFRLGDLAEALGHREKQPSLQLVAYLN